MRCSRSPASLGIGFDSRTYAPALLKFKISTLHASALAVYGPELGTPAALAAASAAYILRVVSGEAGGELDLSPEVEYVLEWHKSMYGIMPPTALHLAINQGTGEPRPKKREAAARLLKGLRGRVGAFNPTTYEAGALHQQAKLDCIAHFCEIAIDKLAVAVTANSETAAFVQSTGGARNAALQTRARNQVVRCASFEKKWREAAMEAGIRLAGVSAEARLPPLCCSCARPDHSAGLVAHLFHLFSSRKRRGTRSRSVLHLLEQSGHRVQTR